MFGNENRTVFRIDARANDGGLAWRGWFDDRDDADAFLYAAILGTLKQERSLWDLPTPNWQPYLGELITYEFATLSFLSVTGTNLTYTFPTDWNNGDNSIETIGAGGSGAAYTVSLGACTGGGGGGYSKITNYIKPGATTSYTIGTGGAGRNSTGGFPKAGQAGGDVYFGNTSLATSSVGSKGGNGGKTGGSGSTTGVSGGSSASGVGTTKYSGGNSGSVSGLTTGRAATGGGGAAGPYGAGGAGANRTGSGTSAGGTGGNGFGGAGAPNAFGPGGDGTEFDATHGSGGGGAGSINNGSAGSGGGKYGGGGGGAAVLSGTILTDAGASGLIVITYNPLIGGLFGGGRSALGMG